MTRLRRAVGVGLVCGALLSPAAAANSEPRPPFNDQTNLEDVVAITPSDAWAVGWVQHDEIRKTFIEHWDGTTWQRVPSPNRSPVHDDVLTSVSAVSGDDVWAVGFFQGHRAGIYRGETLHWDGRHWTSVATPSGHHYTVLSDVVALATDDVWAVGSDTKNEGYWYRSFFEHWDGSSWTIVDDTLPRRRNGPVQAIAAFDRTHLWAGGDKGMFRFGKGTWAPYDDITGVWEMDFSAPNEGWTVSYPATLHWDGTGWTPMNLGWYGNAVVSISPSDAWAVDNENNFQHWDGHVWSAAARARGDLWGIDATGPNDVWAVGGIFLGPQVIEHWDGQSWTVVQG